MFTTFPHAKFMNRCLKSFAIVIFCLMAITPWALSEEGHSRDSAPTNPHASPPGPNTPMPSGIVGIAMHVTAGRIGDPAQLIIRAVHPSGPAARAGLTHGEEIIAVDGEPVAGKTYQEVVGLIRGEIGSSVKLSLRGPQGERTISLMRASEQQLMEQTPPVM
ncbi:MAG: PDZ domain-containing protein [Nitrospirales bacterium]|nr:PDZ domain-containing protein [Nitrospirales bacterium]